jgi:chromatin remodeling complex protein RSC6
MVAAVPSEPSLAPPSHEHQPIENPMASTKKSGKKAVSALMKPVQPDAVLAAVVGGEPMPRSEITKRLWDYIKKNGLQDPKVKTNIRADDKLKVVFGGKAVVTMFEMTKLVSTHIKS